MIDIKVPVLGESITTATVANIHKKVGDFVAEDEIILELETEKINLEITATSAGSISEIVVAVDDEVTVDQLVAKIDESAQAPERKKEELSQEVEDDIVVIPSDSEKVAEFVTPAADLDALSPAVRSLVLEHSVDITKVKPSGKNGRILKSDILEYLENKDKLTSAPVLQETTAPVVQETKVVGSRNIRTQRIPGMRKTIAKRLKESQNTAAMLTTFNEIDMSYVMKVRKSVKEDFAAKNGVNLGFMSFFTKAVCIALSEYEAINAYWKEDTNEIEFHDFCDISIAVASDKGLFVPVIKNAESMSFAQIEQTIKNFGQKAKEGSFKAEELTGGTFSITNGGVFGSMLSTPIINQPQSAILGMHNIVERPVAVDGKVEVRPVMYVALSYDHRMVDGAQAVSFLVRVKDLLENPEKLLFDLY
jgi:2-oxoglutarate dehydrogenase E2 component (dihydrolipoamide succinyltransferase)